jgi:hypothetical protein
MPVQESKEITRVIFRKWHTRYGGEVIALFPEIESGYTMVLSYEHLGQHGGANYESVLRQSRPAAPVEYKALKRELESYPFYYNLKVIRRRPQ